MPDKPKDEQAKPTFREAAKQAIYARTGGTESDADYFRREVNRRLPDGAPQLSRSASYAYLGKPLEGYPSADRQIAIAGALGFKRGYVNRLIGRDFDMDDEDYGDFVASLDPLVENLSPEAQRAIRFQIHALLVAEGLREK